MTAPTFWTIPDFLMREFPHLKSDIEAEYLSSLDAMPNPYPHLFLESYLLPILAGENSEADAVRRRAGEVLDTLLVSADEDLAGAALTSVVEMIAGTPHLVERCSPFLGPTAREWVARLSRR